MKAVQGAGTVSPCVGEAHTIAAVHLVSRTSGVLSPDFEPGRIDQAVDLVLDVAHHDRILGDPVDTLAFGVDQGDVRTVEGLQILVVETRTLAELPIPRLQSLGHLWIAHDLVDP